MIFLLHVAMSFSSPALSPVLVMSSRVAGMTDDLPTQYHPVLLLARSQSSTVLVMSSRVVGMTDDLPTPCRHVHHLTRSQSSTCNVI